MLLSLESHAVTAGDDFFFAVGCLANSSATKETYDGSRNLTRDDMTNEFGAGYSIALFTTGCYFFSEETSAWSSDGCKVNSENRTERIIKSIESGKSTGLDSGSDKGDIMYGSHIILLCYIRSVEGLVCIKTVVLKWAEPFTNRK